jgi:LPXTG-motif cell wall-anchored protein
MLMYFIFAATVAIGAGFVVVRRKRKTQPGAAN